MEGFAAGGFGGDWVGVVEGRLVILGGERGGDGAEKATRFGGLFGGDGRLPLSSGRGREIPRFSPAQILEIFFFTLAQFRSFSVSAAIFPTSF